MVCKKSLFELKVPSLEAVGRVEQSLPDEVEGARSWWEGFGSNRLVVVVCAQGGWASPGHFSLLLPLCC